MAKLSNNIEYFNANFPVEFAEYLLNNQYKCTRDKDNLHFVRKGTKVIVYMESIDVFSYKAELPGDDNLKWVFTGSFTDLKSLDFFGFISLMHDMRAVNVLKFLKDQKERGLQYYTEAKLILNQVI